VIAGEGLESTDSLTKGRGRYRRRPTGDRPDDKKNRPGESENFRTDPKKYCLSALKNPTQYKGGAGNREKV